MKVGQVKIIMYICCALALILIAVSSFFRGSPQYMLIAAGIVFLGVFLYVWRSMWKCPHCGKHLGRDVVNTKYCRKCKRPLE